MEIKEKVAQKLDQQELKNLWEEIYQDFSQEGKDGIKKLLDKKKNKIKEEFNGIKRDVEKQQKVQNDY